MWWYESTPGARFTLSAPVLDAHLQLEWGLFQGFEDVERVHSRHDHFWVVEKFPGEMPPSDV